MYIICDSPVFCLYMELLGHTRLILNLWSKTDFKIWWGLLYILTLRNKIYPYNKLAESVGRLSCRPSAPLPMLRAFVSPTHFCPTFGNPGLTYLLSRILKSFSPLYLATHLSSRPPGNWLKDMGAHFRLLLDWSAAHLVQTALLPVGLAYPSTWHSSSSNWQLYEIILSFFFSALNCGYTGR